MARKTPQKIIEESELKKLICDDGTVTCFDGLNLRKFVPKGIHFAWNGREFYCLHCGTITPQKTAGGSKKYCEHCKQYFNLDDMVIDCNDYITVKVTQGKTVDVKKFRFYVDGNSGKVEVKETASAQLTVFDIWAKSYYSKVLFEYMDQLDMPENTRIAMEFIRGVPLLQPRSGSSFARKIISMPSRYLDAFGMFVKESRAAGASDNLLAIAMSSVDCAVFIGGNFIGKMQDYYPAELEITESVVKNSTAWELRDYEAEIEKLEKKHPNEMGLIWNYMSSNLLKADAVVEIIKNKDILYNPGFCTFIKKYYSNVKTFLKQNHENLKTCDLNVKEHNFQSNMSWLQDCGWSQDQIETAMAGSTTTADVIREVAKLRRSKKAA